MFTTIHHQRKQQQADHAFLIVGRRLLLDDVYGRARSDPEKKQQQLSSQPPLRSPPPLRRPVGVETARGLAVQLNDWGMLDFEEAMAAALEQPQGYSDEVLRAYGEEHFRRHLQHGKPVPSHEVKGGGSGRETGEA